MKRPSLTIRSAAWHATYATPFERYAEFSSVNGGGIIGIRVMDDGTVRVEVSRCDDTVVVIAPARPGDGGATC